MTAYTSIRSGDWDDPGTWTGGGASDWPSTTDDTATIGGQHHVTIPFGLSVSCGAITLSAGSGANRTKLIINGELDLGGTLSLGGVSALEMGAGSVLDLHGNNVVVTAADVQYNFTGTAESHVTVTCSGSPHGKFTQVIQNVVISTWEYVDVSNLDDSMFGRGHTTTGGSFQSFRYCTFDNCADVIIESTNTTANSGFLIEHCDFRNPAQHAALQPAITMPVVLGTRERTIRYCTWSDPDASSTFYGSMSPNSPGTTFIDNVWHNWPFSRANQTDAITERCFLANNCGATPPVALIGQGYGPASSHECYFFCDNNQHQGLNSVSDCVIENTPYLGGSAIGSNWILFGTGGGGTLTCINNIYLGQGNFFCTTGATSADLVMEFRNNTFYVENQGLTQGTDAEGDTIWFGPIIQNEQAGLLTPGGERRVYNNLYVKPDTSYFVEPAIGLNYSTADQLTFVDYNVSYGYDPEVIFSPPLWYRKVFITGQTVGEHDQSFDPEFIDPTRNLAAWDASLGGPGTADNAIVELLKINQSDYDPRYKLSHLLEWVRYGFTATSPYLRGTGYEGGDIGYVAQAIEYVSITSGDWDDPDIWSGGGGTDWPDGPLDNVTIAAGHHVTIPADLTIECGAITLSAGTSPKTELEINGALTLAGDLTVSTNCILSGGPGGSLDIDNYNVTTTTNATGIQYLFNGSDGNRFQITGSGAFTYTGSQTNIISTWAYVDVTGLAASTFGRSYPTDWATVSYDHCSFVMNAAISLDYNSHISNFICTDCDFRGVGGFGLLVRQEGGSSGVDRRIERCTFSSTSETQTNIVVFYASGLQIIDCIFDACRPYPSVAPSFHGCLFNVRTSDYVINGNASAFIDCYFCLSEPSANAHQCNLSNLDLEVSGCVFESFTSPWLSMKWFLQASGFNKTWTFHHNLWLGQGSAIDFVSSVPDDLHPCLYFYNNTSYFSNQGYREGSTSNAIWLRVDHTEATLEANPDVEFYNNLWINPGDEDVDAVVSLTTTITSPPQITFADYNVGFKLPNTTYDPPVRYEMGKDPDCVLYPGTGENDFSVNPQFYDTTRNIAAWDANLGGTGTAAHAITQLLKLNQFDYDPHYNTADLLSWVLAGFTAQNYVLKGTGYEGGDIGFKVELPLSEAILEASETVDTAAFHGYGPGFGTLEGIEAADVASFVGTAITGSLAVTELTDIASFTGYAPVGGILSASETGDTAAIEGELSPGTRYAPLTTKFDYIGLLETGIRQSGVPGAFISETYGYVPLTGSIGATETEDSAAFVGKLTETGRQADLVVNYENETIGVSELGIRQTVVLGIALYETYNLRSVTLEATEATDTATVTGALGLVPVMYYLAGSVHGAQKATPRVLIGVDLPIAATLKVRTVAYAQLKVTPKRRLPNRLFGTNLLYPAATGLERAMADVDAERLTDVEAEAIIDSWDPYEIPLRLLPYLAWAVGVNYWDDNWSEITKRNWVAWQWTAKSMRGTLGGAKMFVDFAGRDVSPFGYKVLSATVPPQRVFSGASLTAAQREAWMATLPQLRVWQHHERWIAPHRKAFLGSDSTGRQHSGRFCLGGTAMGTYAYPTPSRALEHLERRARWIVGGVEQDCRVAETENVGGAIYWQIYVKSTIRYGTFSNRCFGIGAYYRLSDAWKRIITIAPKPELPWPSIAGPTLEPVSSAPTLVKERGVRDHAVFCDLPMRANAYYVPSTAARRVYERYSVNDGSIMSKRPQRPAVQIMGVGRYGFPKFTAWLRPTVGGKRNRWAAGEGITALHHYWIPHDDTGIERVKAAVMASSRLADRIWLDLGPHMRFIADDVVLLADGDPLYAGTTSGTPLVTG